MINNAQLFVVLSKPDSHLSSGGMLVYS